MALMGIIVVAIMDTWVTIVTWRWLGVFPPLAATVSLLSYQYKKPGGNDTDKYRTLKNVWNMNNNLDFKRGISHLSRHLKEYI